MMQNSFKHHLNHITINSQQKITNSSPINFLVIEIY